MSYYKCPHCEYYMWEGKEFYECEFQDKVDRLLRTLQEIKAIAERNIFLSPKLLEINGDIGQIQNIAITQILDLITQAEEE